MPDLVITDTQVLPGKGASYADGTAGEAITAGTVCYLDATTRTYKKADASAQASATVAGIALHASAVGQPLRLQRGGDLTLGAAAAPAVGVIYVLSTNAGGLAPSADAATGDFCAILGVGKAANTLQMALNNTGIQKS